MGETRIEDLKSWIGEIMKNEKVENYELNISGNGLKGDGYVGEITFVTVKSELNASKKNYNFVIKAAKTNDKFREQTLIKEIYLREIYMYSRIFPVFEQFQSKYSIQDPFRKYPKCYKTCEELKKETVVLEDLKIQGFELYNKFVPMNLDHIQFVFKEYARLHATSMAMKQLKPELFRTLTKDMTDVFRNFIIQTNMAYSTIEYFRKALKVLNGNEAKKFDGFESEIDIIFTKTSYDIEDPCTVISHGDCWNNNFMFKYNPSDKTKPVDVRFLDYQLSKVANPILDLSYFLYACCDEEILKNFDKLLNIYHSTLSDSLSQYGIDINTFFPLSKLKEDWKTVGKYGLYMAGAGIQFTLCDNTEAPDFVENVENDQTFVDSLLALMKDDERYDRRIKAILTHFSEKFL